MHPLVNPTAAGKKNPGEKDIIQEGDDLFIKETFDGALDGCLESKTILTHRHCHPWYVHKTPKDARQLCVSSILHKLNYLLPSDAICLLGITMEDLYAGKSDCFTVGMAWGQVAVFSFARYDPRFGKKGSKTQKRSLLDRQLLLSRSCKVAVHEIGWFD